MKHKKLAKALEDFRKEKPWEKIYDNHLFGIRDEETGLWGCASVLGCMGEDFGLSISFGEEGFAIMHRLLNDEIDKDSFLYELDGLLASFEEEDVVQPETADLYDVFLLPGEGKNTAVTWSKQRGGYAHKLNDKEARFLTRALTAVLILSRRGGVDPGKIGMPDSSHPMFTVKGRLPDLDIVESREIIEHSQKSVPEFRLTRQLAGDILAMPEKSCYLVSLWTMPYSVKGNLARAVFIYDDQEDAAVYTNLMAGPEIAPYGKLFFSVLAGRKKTAAPPGRPREIKTDSLELYNHIRDASAKLGIKITFKSEIQKLNKLRESLIDFTDSRNNPDRSSKP